MELQVRSIAVLPFKPELLPKPGITSKTNDHSESQEDHSQWFTELPPPTMFFSIAINIPNTSIQPIFPAPIGNISNIKAQQHPTQKIP